MADTREHRGPHPEDARWFSPEAIPILRRAVEDYSWLLSHGYTERASLKLVGDRFMLSARQRVAVMRSSCSTLAQQMRQTREVLPQECAGRPLVVDGYNVLTTVEAALARGVLLIGRDGCMRDMASMHGSWRKVSETVPAIRLLGVTLETAHIHDVHWLLDSPVSNSGRLKQMILEIAQENGWAWKVQLLANPDAALKGASEVVATADSAILDAGPRWLNLARYAVREHVTGAWVVDLSDAPGERRC